jgi:hypothetical protein
VSDILFVAKVGRSELRIEAENRFMKPFTLECNLERNGSRAFLELPRSYQTVRGAKSAANRLFGGGLEWEAPTAVASTDQTMRTKTQPKTMTESNAQRFPVDLGHTQAERINQFKECVAELELAEAALSELSDESTVDVIERAMSSLRMKQEKVCASAKLMVQYGIIR